MVDYTLLAMELAFFVAQLECRVPVVGGVSTALPGVVTQAVTVPELGALRKIDKVKTGRIILANNKHNK